MDKHRSELDGGGSEGTRAGVINAYIMFSNTFSMQEKLQRVIAESGYDYVNPEQPNYIDSNLNWAYVSAGAGSSPVTVFLVFVGLMFIALTGYLIIYNIFQISVLRDIRNFGLLKTIGTTKKQIRSIINRQAIFLSLLGLPAGMALGYFIGMQIVPQITAQSYYNNSAITIEANPLIFILSGLFTLFTVWVSVRKPGTIAARVSPINAVRYVDSSVKSTAKSKHSTTGSEIHKMALSNLGRNRKRTLLVLISLAFSLVLFNCVFTVATSLDMDKYLARFVDTDFLIAHADYFNYQYSGSINAMNEQLISEIELNPGFDSGGRIYQTNNEIFTVEDSGYAGPYAVAEDGNPFASVYGMDAVLFERLITIDGTLDREKLESGRYVVLGVNVDDYDNPEIGTAPFSIGDTVVLHTYKQQDVFSSEREYTTHTYEISATVRIKSQTNTNRMRNNYTFYLPSSVYMPLTYEKAIMSYAFNAKEGYADEMEQFIKSYTDNVDPLLNYESKSTLENEFIGMKNLLYSLGGILSIVIGLIGILNFINTTLTSVFTRKREFAMLQSVGMTNKQLKKMLLLEGVYYAMGTMIISLALATLLSLTILQPFLWQLWFTSYQFILLPLLISYPLLLIFSAIIPGLALKTIIKESIVERLRIID